MKVNVNVNEKDNIFWALCEIIGEERNKGCRFGSECRTI